MQNQCKYLKLTERNELLKLLQKNEELFDGTFGTWKTDPLYFRLKEDAKPIFLRTYPVPNVYKETF